MPVLGSLSSVADWLEGDGLRILAVVIVAILVSWVGRAIVKRNRRRLEEAASADETISLQRLTTVTRVLADAVTVVVWTVAIIVILAQLEVNLAAILTTAGIAGLALAFAAQNLLRDVMSGFFIVCWRTSSTSATSWSFMWTGRARPDGSGASRSAAP